MRACNYRGFFAVYGESLVESASSSRLAVMSGVRVRGVRCNTCNLILTVVDRCRGAQLRTDSLHGICENQSVRLRVEGLYRCFVAMYVTDRVKYHTRARARTYASTHARTHARTHNRRKHSRKKSSSAFIFLEPVVLNLKELTSSMQLLSFRDPRI